MKSGAPRCLGADQDRDRHKITKCRLRKTENILQVKKGEDTDIHSEMNQENQATARPEELTDHQTDKGTVSSFPPLRSSGLKVLAKRSNIVGPTFEICLSSKMFDQNIAGPTFLLASTRLENSLSLAMVLAPLLLFDLLSC